MWKKYYMNETRLGWIAKYGNNKYGWSNDCSDYEPDITIGYYKNKKHAIEALINNAKNNLNRLMKAFDIKK